MVPRTIYVLLAALSPAAVFAGWSGLVFMPTADILGHREAEFSYALEGTEENVSKEIGHGYGFGFGAFDRLEFGFDNDFNGTTTLNAKLLLLEEPEESRYALAIGAGDFTNGDATTYVVGRHDFDGFRFHAAMLHDTTDRLAVGIDAPLFGESSWSLEYMTGPEAYTWGGLYLPISAVPGLELDLAVGVPARKADGVQYSVGVAYGWTF